MSSCGLRNVLVTGDGVVISVTVTPGGFIDWAPKGFRWSIGIPLTELQTWLRRA